MIQFHDSHIINLLRPTGTYMNLQKEAIIGSDNGLLPLQHQTIIWTNAALLSIKPL